MAALKYDTDFVPAYGEAVQVAPGVSRMTVNNPGGFTFYGTNSYIVGSDALAIIDPGPENEAHFAALVKAIAGRPVSHIFITHTHKDHSPLAMRLSEATGAPILAEGPHRPSRPMRVGEVNPLEESSDHDLRIDRLVADGEVIEGDGWAMEAVFTPGHCANHMCFALTGTGILFSADHVMAWATSIVAPPDGAMSDYMASLDKMLTRDDRIYFPGHGGPVKSPKTFVRGLKAHRKMRERAIIERLRAGDRTIPDLVASIYRDTDPKLHGAAALSVLAQLEGLVESGRAKAEGEVAIDGVFTA